MYDEQIQGSKQNFNGIKFYFCSDGAWWISSPRLLHAQDLNPIHILWELIIKHDLTDQ